MNRQISPRWLGTISYEEGLTIQERILSEKIAGDPVDHLLLLEHQPVYTMGRTRDETSLGNEGMLPHPVHRTNRGGQATYHGPGQLVGYPILDLALFGRDLHAYLRFLEELLILFLRRHGIPGGRIEGKTGVWVREKKIASLGVGVRKWISMHGFAISIHGDLSPFQHITPCGLTGVEMTSMEREGVSGMSVESFGYEIAEMFNQLLQRDFPTEWQSRLERLDEGHHRTALIPRS